MDETPRMIVRAWKLLETELGNNDPELLATLKPGLPKADYWKAVTAWFAAHDGQVERARPLFDGLRLLSGTESDRATKKYRGPMVRRDWNDEWVVVGRGGPSLLCWNPANGGVWVVDVHAKPYRKRKRCIGITQWLSLAASSLAASG